MQESGTGYTHMHEDTLQHCPLCEERVLECTTNMHAYDAERKQNKISLEVLRIFGFVLSLGPKNDQWETENSVTTTPPC